MDYEKKYKEALERAKAIYQGSYKPDTAATIAEILQNVFPELKESEDEKIRKELLEHCKNQAKPYIQTGNKYPQIQSWIAWLEKQGEKSVDDLTPQEVMNIAVSKCFKQDEKIVEPKFKVCDWVVRGKTIAQILDIQEQYYVGLDIDGNDFTSSRFLSDDKIHLWTIAYAKDGDVLVMQKTNVTYESIFIFKKIENNRIIQYLHYFITDTGEEVCELKSVEGFLGFVGTTIHPATKEQRDLLFQKMKEKGYEWDAESKQLLSLKSEP